MPHFGSLNSRSFVFNFQNNLALSLSNKMEITEEQLKRAEANRLAALAKRKALMDSSILQQQQQQQRRQEHNHQSSILFKCRKLCNERNPTIHQISKPALFEQFPDTHLPDKFRVRLEICSPNSFSATPLSVQGFTYPGHDECSSRLSDLLSSVSWQFFYLGSLLFTREQIKSSKLWVL